MARRQISLILPTRGRPDNVARFWNSALDTADGDIEACFYIDSDDMASLKAVELTGQKFAMGKQIPLTRAWNRAFELATGDIIGYVADDVVFRTKGWDTVVRNKIESYSDRITYVYGDDGYKDIPFGTHGFVHRNWIDAVGYFMPTFASAWMDNFFNTVAKEIDRHDKVDILIEHMHWVNGKAEMDGTYKQKEQIPPYNDNPKVRQDAVLSLKAVMA